MDHINPISSEFGIRGRIPRYRLGRYGPHSNDELLQVGSSSDTAGNASIRAQNTSRTSSNMASVQVNRCLRHIRQQVHVASSQCPLAHCIVLSSSIM